MQMSPHVLASLIAQNAMLMDVIQEQMPTVLNHSQAQSFSILKLSTTDIAKSPPFAAC